MKRIGLWFWSPSRDGENWAQTLVRVLGNIVRLFLTVGLIAAVGIAVWFQFESARVDAHNRRLESITVSVQLAPGITPEMAVQEIRRRAEAGSKEAQAVINELDAELAQNAVQSARQSPKPSPPAQDVDGNSLAICTLELPLSVRLVNKSDQTLMRTEIELVGRIPGRSTNELPYNFRRLNWDGIVPPWHSSDACFDVPRDTLEGLMLSGKIVSFSSVLQKTEPWMLAETSARPIAPNCKNKQKTCAPSDRDWEGGLPPEGAIVTEDGIMTYR